MHSSLWFGVSDLDGTVQEERIYHMAGSTVPDEVSTSALRRLIRSAGRDPIERDTLYNVVTGADAPDDPVAWQRRTPGLEPTGASA